MPTESSVGESAVVRHKGILSAAAANVIGAPELTGETVEYELTDSQAASWVFYQGLQCGRSVSIGAPDGIIPLR